jgi:hypothetical protein
MRYYYSSAQNLIDGVKWMVGAFEDGTTWQLTFDRYLYELFTPLTEPPTDTLICNYYHAGQPPVASWRACFRATASTHACLRQCKLRRFEG